MISARRELSNDIHIDYISIYTQNVEKYMAKNRKIIDRWKYSQYGYRLKALDELISKMYILKDFG